MRTPNTQKLYHSPWYLFHRVDLHNQLTRLATEPRPNTKAVAKLNLSSEVVDIDLEGNITLENATKIKKDLLVVSDGVRVRYIRPYSPFLLNCLPPP
jgi:salicylate hydroxylase